MTLVASLNGQAIGSMMPDMSDRRAQPFFFYTMTVVDKVDKDCVEHHAFACLRHRSLFMHGSI